MTVQTNKDLCKTPSHAATAERMRLFALRLKANPEEAKAFREKTGVFDKNGALTAAYR